MWEERNFGPKAKERYPELFVAALSAACENTGCSATGSLRICGDVDASVLVLHGRLRFGLDVEDARADVTVVKGEETVFEGVVSADDVATDEGDEALDRTPVRVREARGKCTEEGRKCACAIVQRALAKAAKDLREEVIAKASEKH